MQVLVPAETWTRHHQESRSLFVSVQTGFCCLQQYTHGCSIAAVCLVHNADMFEALKWQSTCAALQASRSFKPFTKATDL